MRCARCERDNPPLARFCAFCGVGVGSGEPDPSSAEAGPREASREPGADPDSGAERREATIVFSDLSGYTSLNERADPEDVATLIAELRAIAERVAAEHRGTLNQYVGDEVVMLFGVPAAHPDDPVRAVRAALALHAAVRELTGPRFGGASSIDGTALRARTDGGAAVDPDADSAVDANAVAQSEANTDAEVDAPPAGPLDRDARAPLRLVMHSGIGTGLIVTRASGADAAHGGRFATIGDTVNTAARLRALAGPDEVVVGRATWRAVSLHFEGEVRAPVEVRGKARPLEHVRIVAARAEPSAPAPALVGRTAEMARFAARLGESGASGRGGLIVLAGEPGIGKTRLADAWAEQARARGRSVCRALVFDGGVARGRDPLGALTRSLLGLRDDATLETLAAALLHHAAERDGADAAPWPDAERLALHDLLDVPVGIALQGLAEVLDRGERERMLRATLYRLLQRAMQAGPVVVIVEDVHWADPRTLERLASLVGAAAADPVLFVLTTRSESDPTRGASFDAPSARPVDRIELGPLDAAAAEAYAAQFGVIDDGVRGVLIARAAGHPLFLAQLLLNAAEAPDALPGSVHTLVLARLDRLPPRDRTAMQAASVLGQRFTLEMLRHLLQQPGYDAQPLVERQLVRALGAGEYLFGHALIRDGAYESLLKTRRRALHAHAAEFCDRRDPALAAFHYEQAGDPRAAAACARAAAEEARRYRYDAALPWADRGLALATTRPDRFTLQAQRASLLIDLGHPEAALDAWRAAEALATDDRERVGTLVGQAACHRLLGGSAVAGTLLDRAEPLLAAAVPGAGSLLDRSRLEHLRGGIAFAAGDAEACLAAHTRALDAARAAASPDAEAHAYSGLGDVHYMRGRMRSARLHFERCVALAREHGLGRVEVANAQMAAWTAHYDGPLDVALAGLQSALDRALQVHHLRAEMIARLGLSVIGGCLTGRSEGVFEGLDASLEIARRLGAVAFEMQHLACRAHCLWCAGRIDEARALAPEAAARCAERAPLFVGAYAQGVLAMTTPSAAVRDEALAAGAALLARGALSHNHFDFHACAIDALLAAGEPERALAHAQALERYTAAEPLRSSDLTVLRARLLARHRQGERGAPLRRSLLDAVARCEENGLVLRAQALREAASRA